MDGGEKRWGWFCHEVCRDHNRNLHLDYNKLINLRNHCRVTTVLCSGLKDHIPYIPGYTRSTRD